MQQHEKLISSLMKKIYSGELKPRTKLPPESRLTQEYDINRSSLRIALKQLESMHLLDIRQGDGIYVRDYSQNAGIDFLRALFLQEGVYSGDEIIDEFLIDEVWEFWIILFPELLKRAAARCTARDIKSLRDIFERGSEYIADLEMLTEIEIEAQDKIAQVINNTVILMLFNSTRPLRRKMINLLFESLNEQELKKHIEGNIIMLDVFIKNAPELDSAMEMVKDHLGYYRRTIRDHIRLKQKKSDVS